MKPNWPTENIPEAKRIIFGKNQPEYLQLPALIERETVEKTVTTEWELTAEELALLLDGGKIRLKQLTYGSKLQPIKIEVVR